MPVLLLWAVPAVIVIGGGAYWIAHITDGYKAFMGQTPLEKSGGFFSCDNDGVKSNAPLERGIQKGICQYFDLRKHVYTSGGATLSRLNEAASFALASLAVPTS